MTSFIPQVFRYMVDVAGPAMVEYRCANTYGSFPYQLRCGDGPLDTNRRGCYKVCFLLIFTQRNELRFQLVGLHLVRLASSQHLSMSRVYVFLTNVDKQILFWLFSSSPLPPLRQKQLASVTVLRKHCWSSCNKPKILKFRRAFFAKVVKLQCKKMSYLQFFWNLGADLPIYYL